MFFETFIDVLVFKKSYIKIGFQFVVDPFDEKNCFFFDLKKNLYKNLNHVTFQILELFFLLKTQKIFRFTNKAPRPTFFDVFLDYLQCGP